ncbi:MAG: hypothetical protein JO320_18400 [Alphaproteobacteria bacterium]|nr:hypothetical protein [Alphaproteobacteria bacterium]
MRAVSGHLTGSLPPLLRPIGRALSQTLNLGFLCICSTGRTNQSNRTPGHAKNQGSEAKTHVPQILDKVERGDTVIITHLRGAGYDVIYAAEVFSETR